MRACARALRRGGRAGQTRCVQDKASAPRCPTPTLSSSSSSSLTTARCSPGHQRRRVLRLRLAHQRVLVMRQRLVHHLQREGPMLLSRQLSPCLQISPCCCCCYYIQLLPAAAVASCQWLSAVSRLPGQTRCRRRGRPAARQGLPRSRGPGRGSAPQQTAAPLG